MAREFIIRTKEDWGDMVRLAYPAIGVKPFRVRLLEGLKRTVDQNSLFHGVFKQCSNVPIKTKEGIIYKDAKWWKAELKNELGKKSVHFNLDDEQTLIVSSTSEYNTKEASDFCVKIQAYMKTEFQADIILPEPKTKKQ